MNLATVERQLRATQAFAECYPANSPDRNRLTLRQLTLEKQQRSLIFGETNHASYHRQP